MRITEREIRRRVRATIIRESSIREDKLWDMYVPWRAPIPRAISATLAKIMQDIEAHIDKSYPYSGPLVDLWPSTATRIRRDGEIHEKTHGDPVVERAIDVFTAIVRALLPLEIRFTLNSGDDHVRSHVRYKLVEAVHDAWIEGGPNSHAFDQRDVQRLMGAVAAAFKDSSKR